MNIVKKAFFAAGAWPSMAIFWGLILGAKSGAAPAAVLALAYALGYTLIAFGAKRVTHLDFGVALFFAVGAALALSGSAYHLTFLFDRFTTFLYLSLFLMLFLPLVFGAEPFTSVFAKRSTPEAFWNTDLFRSINRLMTLVWSGLFAAAMFITLIPGIWTQILAPGVLLLAVGVPFTKAFPDAYLRSKGLGGRAQLEVNTVPSPLSAETINEAPKGDRAEEAQKLGPVKSILVVFGSPRGEKGYTYKTLDRFLDGVRESGIEPEILFLHKYRIKPCVGCYTCWAKTPGTCIHQDDMPAMREKVAKADLVVYAQPLYVMSVPGITKNFLDRMIPGLDPRLIERPDGSTRHPLRSPGAFGRRLLVFSVCGFPELEHFEPMLGMFRTMSRTTGNPIVGELLRPASESMRFGDGRVPAYRSVMDAFYQAGKEVVTNGYVSRATEQAVSQPLFPDVGSFRDVANTFWKTWGAYEEEKKSGKSMPPLDDYLKRDGAMMFAGMASVYDSSKAGDLEGAFQFNINDGSESSYYIEIKDHKCRFHEGKAPDPRVTVNTPLDVWMSISEGGMSGQEALMKGLYTVDGDLGALIKMGAAFAVNR
ncbi:MAG: NAD(P)H-dependent oxidoreductase [Deltaproteobacteria bacterium]|nr:NAD(P)H-dependent oxidoreductase [Deltaproteobacteria bacterium]